jgi:pimeloyl-ACP methyl ester carboxylesterase
MRIRTPILSLLCVLALAAGASAIVPEQVPDFPVLGPETPRGHIAVADAAPQTPSAKTVDGDVSDWIGTSTRLGGTAIYSAGEYVYQDYLTDDHGADDGRDKQRLDTLDPLRETEPRTYRLDPVAQVVGDEFGVDGPPEISAKPAYGDANIPGNLRHEADIEETRLAADDTNLYVLVRTTGMTVNPGTAVLVLLDTDQGGSYAAPGEITTGAEWAVLVAGDRTLAAYHRGQPVPLPFGGACGPSVAVATNPSDFVNAVELSLCRDVFAPGADEIGVGVATGVVNATGDGLADISTGEAKADLVNVAFRSEEPVRIRMDRDQAIELLGGSLDAFLARVSIGKLAGGATQSFTALPGYFDRIFISHSPVIREEDSGGEFQGAFQHYGLWIPTAYKPGVPNPATVWLHPRSSGNAHLAGAWVPGIIRQLGERRGNIIISPSARGSSTWYVGKGHEDFLEAWDDAMASFTIDPDRVYVAGHSMGGFGSYLVGLLYPDRFAGAFPISGPVTQGGWVGVGDPIEAQNDGDLQAEFLYNVIENARNLPYVIYQGLNDELVFWPGVARMAAHFDELGYRNRFYTFPGQDHYVPLVVDEWADAARYLDSFKRDPNPPQVTYKVWPALEHAVETIGTPSGATLDYHFDGAYWVDDLTVRSGDPADVETTGTFDGVTYGRGYHNETAIPDAGVASVGQTSPYLMVGTQWVSLNDTVARNYARAVLLNIATATLDLGRMGLVTTEPLTLTLSTDGTTTFRLLGTWASPPSVTGVVSSSYAPGVLTLTINVGSAEVTITP